MCMEDVQIGRETQGGQVTVPLTVVSVPLIGESKTRTCLLLPNVLTGNVTYSTNNPAVSGSGFVLNANTGPVLLDLVSHGDLVRRQWFAVMDAGAATVVAFFSDLAREK